MEILLFLLAMCMLAAVIGPWVMRRRGGIRQVAPGSPDAADPDTYGFARQEELDVRMPGPDQDLLDVLDVVQRTQDWRAASQLLAGTPKEGEVRQRVQAFAGAASLELAQQPGRGGSWLRAWRAESPKDAGGAAVHAEFLVQQAWRSSAAGSDDFRIILQEARTVCGEAALLAPGDPVPYIVELAVARAWATSPSSSTSCGRRSSTGPRRTWARTSRRCTSTPSGGTVRARTPRPSPRPPPPAPRRVRCWRRCRCSRCTSTCRRSTWCRASTAVRW
ncbi:hypothetical protein SMICM304S_00087 [Streptomyces microflavus]